MHLFRYFLVPLVVGSVVAGNSLRASNVTRDSRRLKPQGIVGGELAQEGEYPFFVTFYPNLQIGSAGGCGGSLIAPNRVLTAAHCVQGSPPQGVRIGATDTCDGKVINVLCAAIHPDYRRASTGEPIADVAVIKLEESFDGPTISLNTDGLYPSGKAGVGLTVIGFGDTTEGGSLSNRLKKLTTYSASIEACQKNYQGVTPEAHVCADIENAGDCQGDSGGPLFDANGRQVGIVSFGEGCARPSQDVYANVGFYNSWIQSQLTDESCSTYPNREGRARQTVRGWLENAKERGFMGGLSKARNALAGRIRGMLYM